MNLRGIDLNLLTIFEATFEECNQTRTCDRLGMTQSAISNALNRLKQITNDPLFTVRSKGLRPTARAIELYAQVHSALDLVRSGLKDVLGFAPAESTRMFSLAIGFGDGSAVLPILYDLVQREAPQVRINLCAPVSAAETAIKLRDHTLDAVFLHERFDNPDLQYEVIIRHHPVVIVRRDHPRIGDTASRQQVMQEKLVRVAGMRGNPSVMADRDEVFQIIASNTAVVVPSNMAQMAMVARSDLLGFTSLQTAYPFMQTLALKALPMPWEVDPVPGLMVWHSTTDSDAGGAWFRGKLKQAFQSLCPEVALELDF